MTDIESKLEQINTMDIETALGELRRDKIFRSFIAESLVTRGPAIIPAVKQSMANTNDLDLQITCGLMLLFFGNGDGILYLFKAIQEQTDWMCLAASKLASAGVTEAGPYIIEQLRKLPLERMDEITALIVALQRLGTPVPKDIKDRMTARGIPWQIKTQFTEKE
ncbi:MAG TPA: hypothetical protein VJ843_00590 [Candidatus Saccharimonadales bacterium]|nr:hypothetical protein [Candidatus Saccharimonadales bacterium]